MKVAILGSGVIGVTSAWYLAQAGHEVVVIDRQNGPALETSFANAGEISPGYASPWAAPGIPLKALSWLGMRYSPLIIKPKPDLAMARWILDMLGNCNKRDYVINKSRMVRLAEFSRDCLIALRQETGIAYDERSQGTLQLFRTQKQMDSISKDAEVLKAGGVPFEVLDRAGCLAAEPGLMGSTADIVGGLRLPNDETGDCFKFTNALASRAAEIGVRFIYGTEIIGLNEDNGSITCVDTKAGKLKADAYLVAMGSYSPYCLKKLGIYLPIYPVKGYSITTPITDLGRAPQSTLLDETYKIAITRLGDRIRVGGMAEVSGYNLDLPLERRATLEHSLNSLFPGAGDISKSQFWCGLRPMTPDSTPIIGSTKIPNLFLNTGHGTLGWTMACGSGRVIRDIMSGQKPEIETSDLSVMRYR